jgi:CheY-like chemotaxis protein
MSSESKPFQILIAEDNSADVELVRLALKKHDVDCVLHVVPDGAEAIQWIDALDKNTNGKRLDLLLLDMHLPKHDGEDILKRLRSTERHGQTPVVVMTSSDSSILEEKAARLAAVVYFRKPLTLEEFMHLGSIARDVLSRKAEGTESPTRHERGGP